MAGSMRLDEALVERGFYPSRSRARDAVLRGTICVNGNPANKVSQTVTPEMAYVSRAALKLVAGLDGFGFSPAGLIALDIGASTGGFVDVLLERGAAQVIGVDVGHGQMHPRLAGDPRVTNIEGLNARDLLREHFGGKTISFVTSDVSFISLKLALPPALELAEKSARCVLLVKPQFEAGREAIGKGGLLRDASLGPVIAQGLAEWLDNQPGWRSIGILPSPVTGGDGNHEFLLGGVKDQ
jgi:23S rRNA (cytidine1920-2'-O)/16S rRNA (cytidine1409-2'-O)-methyltransferase